MEKIKAYYKTASAWIKHNPVIAAAAAAFIVGWVLGCNHVPF